MKNLLLILLAITLSCNKQNIQPAPSTTPTGQIDSGIYGTYWSTRTCQPPEDNSDSMYVLQYSSSQIKILFGRKTIIQDTFIASVNSSNIIIDPQSFIAYGQGKKWVYTISGSGTINSPSIFCNLRVVWNDSITIPTVYNCDLSAIKVN